MVWKYIQVGGAALLLVVLAGIAFAWKSAMRQQAELQDELKATRQVLAEANQRQSARDLALRAQIERLARQKSTVKSPGQIVASLPDVLPLPVPLSFSTETGPAVNGEGTSAAKSSLPISVPAPKLELPAADLKPLYDFAVDCKECQLRLAAAQADLQDEKVKTAALGRERDSALRAARGGSVARRIVRAAKWFVIGAAAGAVAVKLAH